MKNLIDKIEKLEGSILGINITEEKIKDAIAKNEKIYKCDLLEDLNRKEISTLETNTYNKIVQIKALHKVYQKNKIDYLLCNVEKLEKYIPYIWKNAFQISKKEICFYGIFSKEKKEEFIKKCRRYKSNVKEKNEGKYTFFYIQTEKVPRRKSYFYFILDEVNLFLDKITEILEK